MKAKTFYTHNKKKSTIENEYFIAMDKESFFEMMESFAQFKLEYVNSRIDEHIVRLESEADNKIFAK